MGFIKWLLSFIPVVGPFLSGAISWFGSNVGGWLKTWADHDVQVQQTNAGVAVPIGTAAIQADAVANHDRLTMLQSFKATQFLIVMALFPVLLHQGAVFLDSTPFPFLWGTDWSPAILLHEQGTWHVARLPGVYEDREWLMVAALLGLSNANSIAMGVLKWMHK